MLVKDIPKDADGRHVIHMTLVKRWTDPNGNSQGKLKFHVGDNENAHGCARFVRDASPWFRRSRDGSMLHTTLAEGLRGIARRVEQDLSQRWKIEFVIVYQYN